MLKHEDNERLTRVGPGTPMGTLMRRYWQPILLSSEVAEPDCPPVRVRLLGEDLIAFRDTNGNVGMVDAYCPHRRAPLFFGRNEECGIRCVYHGWKFDIEGNCVDLPSEPADSPMKHKAKLTAYPTVERGGVVWTYMGPSDKRPEPPDYEWTRAPESHRFISKTYQECNWLQAMEGGLDTSHSSYLHNNNLQDKNQLRQRDRAPKIEVHPTDYGYSYISHRSLGEDGSYVKVYQYIMPWQQCRGGITRPSGGRNEVAKIDGHIWVPIDDYQTFTWNWMYGIDETSPISSGYAADWEKMFGRAPEDYIPGTFKLVKNLSNDYLIDREIQRTRTYTGITGTNTQDMALQEGMGSIVDRSKEYLGTSDKAIIGMRQMLLAALDDVEKGGEPKGIEPDVHRDARAADMVVPDGVDWRSHMAEILQARW